MNDENTGEIYQVPIFMVTRNRPIYLWACLDSIYRNTRYPFKLIIADNDSSDPMIKEIIEGFQRRNMIHAVNFCKINDPFRRLWLIEKYKNLIRDYFVFMDSDLSVFPPVNGKCWLTMFVERLTTTNYSVIGGMVDTTDFISEEQAKSSLKKKVLSKSDKELMRYSSTERIFAKRKYKGGMLKRRVPSRFMIMKSNIFSEVPYRCDIPWMQSLRKKGYRFGIDTRVRYRHLSLLNFYDYKMFDHVQRKDQFEKVDQNQKLIRLDE